MTFEGRGPALRARIEVVLAIVFAALTAATFLRPTWIESVSGLEPDGGSGESEWWIVVIFAVVTVGSALLALRDYRIAAGRQAADPS
jgi:hypothetical protein